MNFPNLPGIPDFAKYDPNASILWEQQLNNRFVIYLPPKFAGVPAIPESNTLVLACRQAVQPTFQINTVQDNWFQYTFRFHNASTPTGGTVSFQFRGFMNPRDPAWILLQWIRSAVEIIPQPGGIESYYTGAKNEYMTDGYLFLLTHKMVPFRIIKYAGIFPTTVSNITYSYGTGSLITYSATFAYNWMEFVDLSL